MSSFQYWTDTPSKITKPDYYFTCGDTPFGDYALLVYNEGNATDGIFQLINLPVFHVYNLDQYTGKYVDQDDYSMMYKCITES